MSGGADESGKGNPAIKQNSDGRNHENINESDQQELLHISYSSPCGVNSSPSSPCFISSSNGDIFYTDTFDNDYEPLFSQEEKRSFNAWGGKRSNFNPWGGKRSSFNPWEAKRSNSFNPWGGKRSASFNPWGGKRAGSPQEYLNQVYSPPDLDKRGGFNAWGGKRQILNELASSRAQKNDYPFGRRAPFNPWGGR